MNEQNEQPTEIEVGIVRTARHGRLMAVGAIIGCILAVLITVTQPVDEDATYTLGQISGFMLLVGAVIGLLVGALVALILNRVARKKRGSGVAIHTDVQ